MTVKDANKYGEILNELEGLKKEFEQLIRQRDLANSILNDFPKNDDLNKRTFKNIEKLENIREQISVKIEKLIEEYEILDQKIEKINNPIDRQIIRLRHINRLNFDQIGDTLFYNGGTIKNKYYKIFKNSCTNI